jgi:Tol biopolymer transport system component
VFVRELDGSAEITRARIADGALRDVTRTPEREESWPYWSDGARRVVFQAAPAPRGPSDLFLFDPERGEETPLAEGGARDEHWPVWSPDGARLAYAFRGGPQGGGVAIVELATGATGLVARSSPGALFLRPAFAPDGSRLVAQRRGPKGAFSALWLLAPGRDPARITGDADGFALKACFTRDGRQIVYSRRPLAGGPHDVVRIDAGGGGELVIASAPESDDHSARPSPARDEIAFVSDRAGSFDLYRADLSGGALRRLTDTPGRDELAPRWSPDGERIVVYTDLPEAGGRSPRRRSVRDPRVLVLDREGRVLLETPGLMADWMPPWE